MNVSVREVKQFGNLAHNQSLKIVWMKKFNSMQKILMNMNEKLDEKLYKILDLLQGNISK
jgi:hypothetical protein